jgi:hypothetical protein
MRILICIWFFLSPFPSIASELSLKQVLVHQFNDSQRSHWIDNRIKNETATNKVTSSVWLTDISTFFEKRLDYTETLTGRPTNVTSNLPWNTVLNQKTPYGLNLNIEYYKELANPYFNSMFQAEKIRAKLEFSLINDLFGIRSRRILNHQEHVLKVFEIKTKVDICKEISKKYIQAATLEEKMLLSSETLAHSQKILGNLHQAVQKGAINKTAQTSMLIDVGNLQSENMILLKEYQDANIELEKITAFPIKDTTFKSIRNPDFKRLDLEFYLTTEVLEQEIKNIKSQLDVLYLNRNRDLTLYGGTDSSTFTQNTINIGGQVQYQFIGIRAQWKFGDDFSDNEKKRLESLLKLKEYEYTQEQKTARQKETFYIETLNGLKTLYQNLKAGVKESAELEKRSFRNFYNGNTSYFDFLSTRNQIYALKKSIVETKKQFWDIYFDYLHLKGHIEELCNNGSGL